MNRPTDADAYVIIALTNTMRDLWYEKFPHKDYELFPKEFQGFCEILFYNILNERNQ